MLSGPLCRYSREIIGYRRFSRRKSRKILSFPKSSPEKSKVLLGSLPKILTFLNFHHPFNTRIVSPVAVWHPLFSRTSCSPMLAWYMCQNRPRYVFMRFNKSEDMPTFKSPSFWTDFYFAELVLWFPQTLYQPCLNPSSLPQER